MSYKDDVDEAASNLIQTDYRQITVSPEPAAHPLVALSLVLLVPFRDLMSQTNRDFCSFESKMGSGERLIRGLIGQIFGGVPELAGSAFFIATSNTVILTLAVLLALSAVYIVDAKSTEKYPEPTLKSDNSTGDIIDKQWSVYKLFGLHLYFDKITETGYVSATVAGKDEGGKWAIQKDGVKAEFKIKGLDQLLEVTRTDGKFHIHVLYKILGKTLIDKTWTV
ncbi:hypothetical protein PROFUN_04821 [Planoprotostelium fungivorum]|uniref:Uncharacterized protein n=1 Tax=Planoprotostelium fungivorum TaxID=1890364 RepID=A0A2P6NSY7_9EUKA|nr:hypothetical protein PROFUN_04821 [Planoprotostelium fungivorum]